MFECERCGVERSPPKYRAVTKYCQPCSVAVYNATRPPAKPGRKKAYNQTYYKARKPYWRSNEAVYRARLREQMITSYGGKCGYCGIDNPIVLVLDHKFDQARKDCELLGERGGYRLYAKLRKLGWPQDNYQLLCHNCNYIKEHERKRRGRKYAI